MDENLSRVSKYVTSDFVSVTYAQSLLHMLDITSYYLLNSLRFARTTNSL